MPENAPPTAKEFYWLDIYHHVHGVIFLIAAHDGILDSSNSSDNVHLLAISNLKQYNTRNT